MKLYKLVNVLGALNDTGKLASDMYELGKKRYYSKAHEQEIPISEMDFQHMVRAFVKLNEEVKYFKKLNEDGFISSVHDLDKIERLESFNEHNHKVYKKNLKEQEDRLQAIIDEKDELIDKWSEAEHRWRKAYQDVAHTNGHYYTFSEVPQDEEGKEFVKSCRKYLNKESYNIRVKGQHLKKELYGQGRAYHGANMEDSTHMRVYIDKK